MSEKMLVALDAMGGDNAPYAMIEGTVNAVNGNNNIKVVLVGKEEIISQELSKYKYNADQIEIVNATEVIETAEHPVAAIKKKKDSSMVVGLHLLKDKKVDAFVSAGNSGALLTGGLGIVGRIRGIERPPFGALFPVRTGVCLMCDSGANVDVRPSHMVQFAQMGSIYMEHVLGIKNPRVAIVNIGAEEEKGNALVKETFPLLKECEGINFIGSIEARDIPEGYADVIICDGFVGNVILKLYEGLSSTLLSVIKAGLKSTVMSKVGAALALPALKKTVKSFDATKYGGAPLLGLNGLVVKTHGSAKAVEIENTILQCDMFKKQAINEKIKENLVLNKTKEEN
ncbi:MAG: phosphate acyltransferase PlsX [Pseudobutyrivibrio sp.]|nr:phosphate acyltransferase PlsX [Pseudobutyrivibrio sp.]